jgi:aminopeptidase N
MAHLLVSFFLCLCTPLVVVGAASTAEGLEGDYRLVGHDLQVELDPQAHSLKARDIISLELGDEETVFLSFNTTFQIHSVKIGPQEVSPVRLGKAGKEGIEVSIPPALRGKKIVLVVSYAGVLYEPLDPFHEPQSTITPEFIYLSPHAHWYPDPSDSMGVFRVTATVPSGYEVVTHGNLIERRGVQLNAPTCTFLWEADYPAENCYLIAAPYNVTHQRHGEIDLYTYFFPEEQGLVENYMEASKKYLDMYQKMLGPYPFKRFTVVENLFPTGYGMPSYTLIGRQVLKMPFIVHISLGHEIAHNWWGNCVIPHPEHGNWCEGLTSYLADYYYNELIGPGPAMDYRREILRSYASFITEENDFALEGFTGGSVGRAEKATRSILYGKAAMVFHMLRNMVGDEHFFQALRKLYVDKKWQLTTWEDFRLAFEEQSGRDLGGFFKQWVHQKGSPSLELGEVRLKEEAGAFQVGFKLKQTTPPYRLRIPVVLTHKEGTQSALLEMDSQSGEFSLKSPSRPISLAIDPELNLFRRLHPLELPPTIDRALGDESLLIVRPSEGRPQLLEGYGIAVHMIEPHGEVKTDKEVTEADLTRTLFILGGPGNNLLLKRFPSLFPPELLLAEEGFTFQDKKYGTDASILLSLRNPFARDKTVCIFLGQEAEAIRPAIRKFIHYGKYSYVVFEEGVSVDKGTFTEEAHPLVHYF